MAGIRVPLTACLLLTGGAVVSLWGQSPAVVSQEHAAFAEWLRSAPLSPRRAVGLFPVGEGLTLGPPTAAIPLAGIAPAQIVVRSGRVMLAVEGAPERPLVRGRAVALGAWHLVLSGPGNRVTLTVFATERRAGKDPEWFPYDSAAALTATLIPSAAPGTVRVLGPDGVEVDATEAGTIRFRLGGTEQSLRVRRLPGASEEETELQIYFRDPSNGRTTYPAGRFVSLIPRTGNQYLLDFNRAAHPFCAYNTAYPCPAPWRGNALTTPVRAGERYAGGGLSTPPGA